jgi:hypothetical protein
MLCPFQTRCLSTLRLFTEGNCENQTTMATFLALESQHGEEKRSWYRGTLFNAFVIGGVGFLAPGDLDCGTPCPRLEREAQNPRFLSMPQMLLCLD